MLKSQFGATYEVKDEHMGAYVDVARSLTHRSTLVVITQMPRINILHAYSLAYLVATITVHSPRNIVIEFQPEPSIELLIEKFKGLYYR